MNTNRVYVIVVLVVMGVIAVDQVTEVEGRNPVDQRTGLAISKPIQFEIIDVG